MTAHRQTALRPSAAAMAFTTWVALSGFARADLAFVTPADKSIYKLGEEIPVMLQAQADNDVFPGAELFANGVSFASAYFCCWLCPCAHPTDGIATTLQIPAPHEDPPNPGGNPWQGWIPGAPGTYVLTARATGESGTVLEASPITITVESAGLRLHVQRAADGTMQFVLPEGSLVPGGFLMQVSHDLNTWTTLGPFEPGNVAAFYRDHPDETDPRPRFYRALAAQ